MTIFTIAMILVLFLSTTIPALTKARRGDLSRKNGWHFYSIANGLLLFILSALVSNPFSDEDSPALIVGLVIGMIVVHVISLFAYNQAIRKENGAHVYGLLFAVVSAGMGFLIVTL